MAAVTVKEDAQFDGPQLYNHVVHYLPSYARPRFIRIQVNFIRHTLYCNPTQLFFAYFVFSFHLECGGVDRDVQANEGEVSGRRI